MALTQCKECGHDVSTTAAICPNCGAPDFLSDEGKEALRKERQREQLRAMVEKGGTEELTSTKKKKKERQKREDSTPQRVVVTPSPRRESNVSKGFGLGCGLVFGVIAAIIAIAILIPLLGIGMCGPASKTISDLDEAKETYQKEKVQEEMVSEPAKKIKAVKTVKTEEQVYIERLEILNTSVGYHKFLEKWEVTGSIKNTGNKAVKDIKLRIYPLDNSGSSLAGETAYPAVGQRIKPGQTIDFSHMMNRSPVSWSKKVKLEIIDIYLYSDS